MSDSTVAAQWREEGKPDPHGEQYNCERAKLAMGYLTDDQLANAVYLYDHRAGFESLAHITAAKERIRWLSRKLEETLAENQRLRQQQT